MRPCPKPLPRDLTEAASQLAKAYLDSPIRPNLAPEVVRHWDALISAWSESKEMPLLIRKQGADIGDLLIHRNTGRLLAPCDNSPAHWVISKAFTKGTKFKLKDVKNAITRHEIPVTMAMSNKDIEASRMKGVLAKMKEINVSKLKWKVDHIDEVGLKQRLLIQEMEIGDLKAHFVRLMSPSNVILVPSVLKGLGDLPIFIEEIRDRMKKSVHAVAS